MQCCIRPVIFIFIDETSIMKKFPLSVAGLLAVMFNVGGLAVYAANGPISEPYRYGMNLDIKQVLSFHEEPSVSCQVVKARMDYLDSSGQLRSLEYQKLSETCGNYG